jgi:hypothetical protein
MKIEKAKNKVFKLQGVKKYLTLKLRKLWSCLANNIKKFHFIFTFFNNNQYQNIFFFLLFISKKKFFIIIQIKN